MCTNYFSKLEVDMSDADFDFSNEIQKASWQILEPHHRRGGLFVVSKQLELAVVADALARDKVNQVKIWLDNGDFKKVEDEDTKDFSMESLDEIAEFVIVQPYVLIQYL